MIEFLTQHQFWTAVVLYWIFSAAVSAMPEPAPCRAGASPPDPGTGNPGYIWLYRFLHTVAGNVTTAFAGRLPGLKTLTVLLVLLLTTACAAGYKVHPGALNLTDSAAYDTLLVAESAIDQARTETQTRPPGPEAREALNALVRSYNVAREAWLTYRGALATKMPSDQYFQRLTQNLADLTAALEALRTGGVR
jgi:hypothetical protein